MWNLEKNDMDEPICKVEVETQMYDQRYRYQGGE